MTKRNAMILALLSAAGFQACRTGKAPLPAVDAGEEKPMQAADGQNAAGLEEEAGPIQSADAGPGEQVEPGTAGAPDGEVDAATEPPEAGKAASQGKEKKKKKGKQSGECEYVRCFDLCCDKGQVCAHTHGAGGAGPFPASHKCLTPPK